MSSILDSLFSSLDPSVKQDFLNLKQECESVNGNVEKIDVCAQAITNRLKEIKSNLKDEIDDRFTSGSFGSDPIATYVFMIESYKMLRSLLRKPKQDKDPEKEIEIIDEKIDALNSKKDLIKAKITVKLKDKSQSQSQSSPSHTLSFDAVKNLVPKQKKGKLITLTIDDVNEVNKTIKKPRMKKQKE